MTTDNQRATHTHISSPMPVESSVPRSAPSKKERNDRRRRRRRRRRSLFLHSASYLFISLFYWPHSAPHDVSSVSHLFICIVF